MSINVYKFNYEQEKKHSIPLAWPVKVYKCLIPADVSKEVNILEELILKLIKNVFTERNILKNFLKCEIALDEKLINNVISDCEDKGLIAVKDSKISLSPKGKETLANLESQIVDLTKCNMLKKVVVFQDLVSGRVIPCFSKDQPPVNFEKAEGNSEWLILPKKQTNPIKIKNIKNAILYWDKIYKAMRTGESTKKIDIDVSEGDLFDIKTIAPIQEDSYIEIDKGFEIIDNKPEEMYIKALMYTDEVNCLTPKIESPFGESLNSWFEQVFMLELAMTHEIKEMIELFIEESKEEFKDKIAFENKENIELFDEFPIICNDEKYESLKQIIERVYITKNQVVEKGQDVGIVLSALRIFGAEIVRVMLKSIHNIESIYNMYVGDNGVKKYRSNLEYVFCTNNGLESCEYFAHNEDLFNHIQDIIKRKKEKDDIEIKPGLILLLLYSVNYPDCKITQFIRDYPNIIVELKDISFDGNSGAHKAITKIDQNKVFRKIPEYMNIVRVVFSQYINNI